MKPIELQLCAFGQYRQPQTVRFDGLDAVFLIAGETGAGKTTLFDAISYALYGRGLGTRRLGLELRSQLAGAEESTLVRFRFAVRGVEWQVARSPYQFVRRKRTGAVQAEAFARLERLSGPAGPEAIPADEVDERIRQVIGLRYEDFSKILVLPQGEFQQFLAMRSAERAQLLRTLFPVAAHAAVTQLAKDAVRGIKGEVDAADAVIAELASSCNEASFPDDERALIDAVAALQAEADARSLAQVVAQDALGQARVLAAQRVELSGKRDAAAALAATRPGQEARLAEQGAAQRAAEVVPALERHARLAAEIDRLAAALPGAAAKEAAAAAAVADLASAAAGLEARRAAAATSQSAAEAMARRVTELTRLVAALDDERQAAAAVTAAAAKTERAVARRREADMALSALDGIAAAREALRPALAAAEAGWHACELAAQDAAHVDDWQTRAAAESAARIAAEALTLTAHAESLRAAERDHTAAVQRVESSAALTVAAALVPGEPCPACGSRDHPAPHTGNAADPRALERLRQAEKLLNAARAAHTAADKLVDQLRAARELAAAAAQAAALRLQDAGHPDPAAWRQTRDALAVVLAAKRGEDAELAAQLAGRSTAVAAVAAAQLAVETAQAAATHAALRHGECGATVSDLRQRVGEVTDVSAALHAETERHATATAALRVEIAAIGALQTAWTRAQNLWTAAAAAREAAVNAHAAAAALLPAAVDAVAAAVESAGFADAAAVTAAARTAGQMRELQADIVAWQAQTTSLADAIAVLEAAIAGRGAPDLEAAEGAAEAALAASQMATAARAAKAAELQQLRARAANLQQKRAERAQLVAGAQGMLTLAQVLGGERAPRIDFATWMLTWWLERVLQQANQRMRELSDRRYTFALRTTTRDGRSSAGLDVDVLDAWSNQRRDVNALSGGEKFLAALALALGLADVVQALNGGVQLDTLFIDEGFGGLDAETLDRAMELIHRLAEHRAVGLISHVEAMQKAIVSQVRVSKSPQGSQVTVTRAAVL